MREGMEVRVRRATIVALIFEDGGKTERDLVCNATLSSLYRNINNIKILQFNFRLHFGLSENPKKRCSGVQSAKPYEAIL